MEEDNDLGKIIKTKPKKVKKKSELWLYGSIIFIVLFVGYMVNVSINNNKEVDTFCKQFNMTKGNCDNDCCEARINDNLIQQVTVKKIDGKYVFVQEGLR